MGGCRSDSVARVILSQINNIYLMKYLTVKECAKIMKVSTRTIQRKCKKDNINKDEVQYLITDSNLKKWFLEMSPKKKGVASTLSQDEPKEQVTEDVSAAEKESDMIIEEFTPKEYEHLEFIIKDHAVLKERTKQQEKQLDKQDEYLRTMQDNLKLANARLDALLNSFGDSMGVISRQQQLDFLDKTKPKD